MGTTAAMSALAVIVGSVREGRFGPVVAGWFVGQAKQRDDLSVDVIDLADTPVPSANFTSRIGAAATAACPAGLARSSNVAPCSPSSTPSPYAGSTE